MRITARDWRKSSESGPARSLRGNRPAGSSGIWRSSQKMMGIDVGGRSKRSRRREWSRRPGMATPAQLRKIEAMWSGVSRQKTAGERRKALGAFLEKRFGVSDLAFVTHEMPSRIIHTLEAMKKQAPGATE